MIKAILRLIAITVLVFIPYWPVTENFFPPAEQVDANTFGTYLLLCGALVIIALLLMHSLKAGKAIIGWLFFSIGMVSMVPLHLGPPREGPELLTASCIEQARYGMLLIAVVLFFFGGLKAIIPTVAPAGKLLLTLVVITTAFNLWDNYSSFVFSAEMQAWVNAGKKAEDFFANYDFHELWRTVARSMLYASAGWLSLLFFKRKQIRKWQMFALNIFCITGLTMCLLFLLKGPAFYFPFMVPAIALAPAYWLGIALICNRKIAGDKSESQ